MDNLLTIGQFSRTCWLSIKALRLYDDLGLLIPVYVDPTSNYRYYHPEQAPAARAIAILRTLDMPLAQIREVVTGSDPDKIRAHLDTHRQLLADRVSRDLHMLERVENFIKKGAVMTYEIELKDLPPTDVVSLRLETTIETISADAGPAYHRIYDQMTAAGIYPAGPPRMVYHRMDDDGWTIEACVPAANSGTLPDDLTQRSFPGGKVARTIHVGPYEELGMAYREMEVWLDKRGLHTANPPFDVYLNDPSEVNSPAELQTELIWPVK